MPDLYADEDDYRDWSEDEVGGAEEGFEHQEQVFPQLVSEINAAITELHGAVVPKLNWSSPKDALWVTSGNTLRCTNADEVLLLLKSSDRIAHDICHAFDSCPEAAPQLPHNFQLALRKWYSLRPEREFRCFVRGHDLVGVSQRHVMEYFPELQGRQEEISELLLEFFEEHLENQFPEADYTFDAYVATTGKVKLMDFNPIGSTTNPLLFEWHELPYPLLNTIPAADGEHQKNEVSLMSPGSQGLGFDFRIVTEPNSLGTRLPTQGVPFDLVDRGEGGAAEELLAHLRNTALRDGFVVSQ